jgi:hypothetical protein
MASTEHDVNRACRERRDREEGRQLSFGDLLVVEGAHSGLIGVDPCW